MMNNKLMTIGINIILRYILFVSWKIYRSTIIINVSILVIINEPLYIYIDKSGYFMDDHVIPCEVFWIFIATFVWINSNQSGLKIVYTLHK